MGEEIDPSKVKKVMAEFDRIGENAFFEKYGGGRAKKYKVINPDDLHKSYPSAAIAQAALGWDDIRGGYDNNYSACVMLERAGFEILNAHQLAAIELAAAAQIEAETLSATERQTLVAQRIGQNILRAQLIRLRGEECELTGIIDPHLLRASHIKPWASCEDARERYDTDNAILLSALWDAAFDRGFVSFDDEGEPLFSSKLSKRARRTLQKDLNSSFWPSDEQCVYLRWHRKHLFRL